MDDENIMDVEYPFNDKLGPCEVCGAKVSKYTCPKCEVKTCSLTCVRIHKKELECDGLRDKTKFIRMNAFTNLDLLSDYRLLEQVSRSVDKYKDDKLKQYNKQNQELPLHLYRLRAAATRREVVLKFLPQQFTRRKTNTTYLDWKTQTIHWKIEWIFAGADNLLLTDARCIETDQLGVHLNKYFDPDNLDKIVSDQLKFYHSAGINRIKVLLKAEEKRGKKFYELDLSKTLKDLLKFKIIIENPIILVIFQNQIDEYELIDSDIERLNADKEYENDKSNVMKRLLDIKNERIKRKKKKNLLISSIGSDIESTDSDTDN